MKKIILSLLLTTSTLLLGNVDFNYDQTTINNINTKENRSNENYLVEFFNKTQVNEEIVKLSIPPLFNTNVGCGGIGANLDDVYDVLMSQFESIAKQVPSLMLQSYLGMPDLSSPGAVFDYATNLTIELGCWSSIAGVQVLQTSTESSLDYIQKLYSTAEKEGDKQAGTSINNGGALGHKSATQDQKRTIGLNKEAAKKTIAENNAETLKETTKKVSECILKMQKSYKRLMNQKMQKFKALKVSKKKMFRNSCDIIEEKGEKTNLNDFLPNKGVIELPIFYKTTKQAQKLKMENKIITSVISINAKGKVSNNAFIKDIGIDSIFTDKLELSQSQYVPNSINENIYSNGLIIINQFTTCLNDPSGSNCSVLSANNNFLFDFNNKINSDGKSSVSLINILLKKKRICSFLTSSSDLKDIEESFNIILNLNGAYKINGLLTKQILDIFIRDEYCNYQFREEVKKLESSMITKIEDLKNSIISSNYQLNNKLDILKEYKTVLEQIDISNSAKQKKFDKLTFICAFNKAKKGKSFKIHYMEGKNKKSKEFTKLAEAQKFFQNSYNTKINPFYSAYPVIIDGTDCIVDKTANTFKEMYKKYKEEKKKGKLAYSKISTEEQLIEELKQERKKSLLQAMEINNYYAELGYDVITEFLDTELQKYLIILKN